MVKNKQQTHDGRLWDRLRQIIKVEEPIEFNAIRRFCRDVPGPEVDAMLRTMTRAGNLHCDAWDWPKLVYTIAE